VAEPIDVVREFCDAWGTPAAIEAALALLEKVEFETLAIAANGSTVLTERIDTFFFPDNSIALPVMGTFEVNADGKISAWRDYFDMNQFLSQMA
jgi:limonene-1,2-epoxide hydrolase